LHAVVGHVIALDANECYAVVVVVLPACHA
jgi:hypothetical protein